MSTEFRLGDGEFWLLVLSSKKWELAENRMSSFAKQETLPWILSLDLQVRQDKKKAYFGCTKKRHTCPIAESKKISVTALCTPSID